MTFLETSEIASVKLVIRVFGRLFLKEPWPLLDVDDVEVSLFSETGRKVPLMSSGT